MLTTRYHLDEARLKHYDARLKSWALSQPVKTIPSSLYPWTQTDKAGAVTCWPVGGTQLKPSVDFLFTETPPASGDKSPSNPSTITGVSSVLLSQIGGKNLLAYNFPTATVPNNTTKTVGQTTATNVNGTYSLSGTVTSSVNNIYITHETEEQNKLKIPAGTYTLSGFSVPASVTAFTRLTLQLIDIEDGTVTPIYCNGSTTFTIDKTKICNVYIRGAQYTVYPQGFTCSPQLERGSEATSFEPSYVTNYTLPLGSTYYGGTLDVSTGVMTVTHRMFTITGTTAMSTTGYAEGTDAYRIGYYLPDKERTASGSVVPPGYACDTLPIVMNPTPSGSLCWGLASASTACYIRFPKELIGAGDDLPLGTVRPLAQAWLAQHPVTVAYPMVETNYQTVQLDPVSISALAQSDKYTPRLNTVYTDAQSVQVGYVKSPIREEYELTQAIVAQGGEI